MCVHTKRFQFVLRAKKVASPIKKPETFLCRISGQNYCGHCSIKQCPANVAGRHPSGCLYLFYENNKSEFDKYDIMYALDIKERTFKTLYEQGYRSTTSVVTLYRILSMLREQSKDLQCLHCGIFKSKSTECQNLKVCRYRQKILNNVLKHSNLRFEELKTSLQDVYLLLKYVDNVSQYLKKQNFSGLSNLNHLLGLPEKTYQSLTNIPIYSED